MKTALYALLLSLLACFVFSVPVRPAKKAKSDTDNDDTAAHMDEYKRYVQQVLEVLGEHPDLREKIEAASEEEIANGELGKEISKLAPTYIRSQLDEAKRQTIQRQRLILRKRLEKQEGTRQRLDAHDEELFGGEVPEFDASDLKQVMLSRQEELKKEDKTRHDQFVKLEMDKEHQRRLALKKMGEKDRLEAEEKHKFVQEKKKDHPKLHHPGSEAQFKEVWEKEDGLDAQDFNPRTFFELHDTNGDGYLDTYELEALFINEVQKVYDEDEPEMQEEISRMREHVFGEVDKDQDGLIAYDEFKTSTELTSFSEDPGWQGLDEEDIYTDEEMEEYERMLQEEMESIDQESQNLIEKNKTPDEHGEKTVEVENAGEHHENVDVGEHREEVKTEEHHEEVKTEEHHEEKPAEEKQQEQHHEEKKEENEPQKQQEHHEEVKADAPHGDGDKPAEGQEHAGGEEKKEG